MKKEKLEWEAVSVEHVIQDEWIDFRRIRYRFPDGSEYEPFYSYSRKNYVVIVASDTEGNFLTVHQYRQGIREVTNEFPAGCVETDGSGRCLRPDGEGVICETVLEAAKRELREETGYVSEDWEYVTSIADNATLADNYGYIFRARNCTHDEEQSLDITEFLNAATVSGEQIESWVRQGKFQQAVHVMAWYMIKDRERK